MRRAVVVIVQADLAAGDHLRLGQQIVELGKNGVVDLRRVVRINPGAGEELREAGLPVELAADFQSPSHSRGVLANADGQHRAHPRLPGAAQHQFTVAVIALAVQVGVGINQQSGKPPKPDCGIP